MTIFSRIREFFNRPVIGTDPRPVVVVQKGDTLSSLAKRHLGAASRWKEIWNLNVTAIGTNPHKIRPGTVLVLPRKGEP